MPQYFFLHPGTDPKYQKFGGSLYAAVLEASIGESHPVTHVTYDLADPADDPLSKVLATAPPNATWFTYWGPHLGPLQRRLAGRRVIIFAQSFDYQFEISPQTAIIALSRFIQSSYCLRFPHNPVYLLHPWISTAPHDVHAPRPVDVLHLSRKSALWLREGPLLPRLREAGLNVQEISGFVKREDVLAAYVQAKTYLYSVDVARIGVEGFGGQPVEAALHGCIVFTEFGAGLSDFLAFGPRVQQLGVGDIDYDIRRITAAVRDYRAPAPGELAALEVLTDRERFRSQLAAILVDIAAFHASATCSAGTGYRALSAVLEAARQRQLHPPLYRRVISKVRRTMAPPRAAPERQT